MTKKNKNISFLIAILAFGVLFGITFYSNIDFITTSAQENNISELQALSNFSDGNEYNLVLLFSFYAFIFSIFAYVLYSTINFLNFLFKK